MHGSADAQIAQQLERTIHRVKRSMSYRGSYSTHDILDSLVARWICSGEWERLKRIPTEERHLGESVRRFLLDRFDQVRRRGERHDLDLSTLALPDDQSLAELVALAELRAWIVARVAELAAGTVDPRIRIRLAEPTEVGRIVQLQLDGCSQRQIAETLGISLGLVNKRLADGTRYLVLLQSIEDGVA